MSAASARNPHGGKHPAERAAARPAVHYSRQLCTRAGPTVAARAARPPGRLLTTITIFGFPSVRPGFSPGAAPDSAEQVFRWYSRDRGLTNCSVFLGAQSCWVLRTRPADARAEQRSYARSEARLLFLPAGSVGSARACGHILSVFFIPFSFRLRARRVILHARGERDG